jgi:hypothetical protein
MVTLFGFSYFRFAFFGFNHMDEIGRELTFAPSEQAQAQPQLQWPSHPQ